LYAYSTSGTAAVFTSCSTSVNRLALLSTLLFLFVNKHVLLADFSCIDRLDAHTGTRQASMTMSLSQLSVVVAVVLVAVVWYRTIYQLIER
jgi:hypothetical protein